MASKYSAKSRIVPIEMFSSTKILQPTPQEVSILITTSSLFEVYLLSACEVKQKTEKRMIEDFFHLTSRLGMPTLIRLFGMCLLFYEVGLN